MKNNFFKLCLGVAFVLFLGSCKRDGAIPNADVRNFNPDTFVPGPLDAWLKTEFLDPYNIEVVYRWKRELTAQNKDISPPLEFQVRPAMEVVKAVWIKPYETIAGATFIKTLSPKQIVLLGSAEYNENGSITLGTAEGGRKIILNVINYFDATNGLGLKQMMKTIHHEFMHIINQIVDIPADFQTISRGGYFGNWTTESDATALALGFVSRYARTNEKEDFAEMASHLLVEGQFWFDNRVAAAPTADAASKLRQKETALVDYYYQNFGIDFRALQKEVEKAMLSIASFPSLIRTDNIASITNMTPKGKRVKSTKFEVVWDTAVVKLKNSSAAGFLLTNMQHFFLSSSALVIRYTFTNAAGTATYNADFAFNINVLADGTTTFTATTPFGAGTTWNNAAVIANGMKFLNDYWTTNIFVADWLPDYLPGAWGFFAGYYLKSDKTNYFYGNIAQ